jgi:hypothetical protein
MAFRNTRRSVLSEARTYLREQMALSRRDYMTIHRELELRGVPTPSRSQWYLWIREEQKKAAADTSGPWSLADDQTGRPDIVLALLSWVIGESQWQRRSLTVREAFWAVRLCAALPRFVEGMVLGAHEDRVAVKKERSATSLPWFWSWVLVYGQAHALDDDARGDTMRGLDAELVRHLFLDADARSAQERDRTLEP